MKENKLSSSFTWFLILAVFLLPIFFLPHLINPIYNSKLMLTFLIAFAGIFVFIVQSLKQKKWQLIKTPLTLPLFAFAVLVIISSLVNHQYPSGQFLGSGGIYLSFVVIVLLAPSVLNHLNRDKLNKQFSVAITAAATLLSVLSILQFFGIGLPSLISKISTWQLANDLSFSLTGFTFVTVQLLSVVLLSSVLDQKNWMSSWFHKIASVLIAVALGINIWAVLPGGQANFQNLSLAASSSVARESLAWTKTAVFGYGPEAYSNAFNILKPMWVNGLSYWQSTFDSAFNFPLTLIVNLGIIGLLIYLFFLWQTVSTVKKANEQNIFLKFFIFGALIWQFFSPVNMVMFILLAIALAFFVAAQQDQYQKIDFSVHPVTELENDSALNQEQIKLAKIKNFVLISGNAVLLVALSLALYISAKSFVAYNLLYQTNASIANNEITKAYANYNQAKNLAPELDFIRRSNALINLNIAIALSNKTDITPAEQEQVLQLINQSITEAKAATVLSPLNYQNWYVLSQIYMQLLETTDQAKQEAFNALAKAITYNPNNPELRLVMGQLFLSSKDYANAITFFSQAVERKQDLPIAHYYLAQALLANEQLVEAQTAFSNTMLLLEKDSEDYKTVEKELQAVTARIEAAKTSTQNTEVPTESPQASESAKLFDVPTGNSGLSNLLDQQETETVIQDGALINDQNLVEN